MSITNRKSVRSLLQVLRRSIASVDPTVIGKVRIDFEIIRLSRLHCEHQRTMFRLASRVHHLAGGMSRLERRLKENVT